MLDTVEIVQADPADDEALRRYWEVEQAAARANRPHALLRTWSTLLANARSTGPYRRTFLVALDGGRAIGVAELGGSREDNTHLADVEVLVLPEHRREGVGRALYAEVARRCADDGRTSLCGEVHVPHGTDPSVAAPYAFAVAMGLEQVHEEDHLVLALPADEGRVADLRARAEARSEGYDVVTWGDRCPDEHVEAFCAMRTRMDADVPTGEVDVQPVVHTVERQRGSEERVSRSYSSIVAAARRRSDGVLAGYSHVYLPHGEREVLQDDTLVMPDHRGRRLGTLLKLATLDVLTREHPATTALHTWTAPDNHAMQRTNRDFGFRVVERMYEMQVKHG